MAISFGCPHCGRRFEVPDHLEGKQARCQTCGNVVTVAREAVVIADPVQEPDLWAASSADMPGPMVGDPLSSSTGPGGASRRSGIPPWAVAAIGCGAAVVLGLIVLVVSSAFSGGPKAPADNREQADRSPIEDPQKGQTPPALPRPPTSPNRRVVNGTFTPKDPQKAPKATPEPEAPPGSSWPVTADPGPARPAVHALDVGEKTIETVCFARNGKRAVITQSSRLPGGKNSQAALYDLEAGRLIGSAELPKDAKVAAISYDGASMAVVAGFLLKEVDRLAVWDWKDGGIAARTPMRVAENHSQVKWASYLTQKHLFFRGDGDETHLIDVRTGQIIYSISTSNSSGLTVSPGGRWLATYASNRGGKAVQLRNAATGKVVAKLETGYEDSTSFRDLAFSPDGQEVTLLLERHEPASHLVFRWDLQTGKAQGRFGVPLQSEFHSDEVGIWWCGRDYLLVDGTLCRMSTGQPVWRYENKVLGQLSDGRVWLAISEFGRHSLVPVELPLRAQQAAINEAESRHRPVLVAGDGLRLEIRGADRSPSGEFPGELSEMLRGRIVKQGYRVDETTRVCLRASISDKDKGGSSEYEYSMGDRAGQTFSVPNRVIHLKLELVDSNGAVQWEYEIEQGLLGGFGGQFLSGESDPVTELLNDRWGYLLHDVKRLELPVPWYASGAAEDLASMTIDRKALTSASGDGEAPLVAGLDSGWTYQQDATPAITKEYVNKRVRFDKRRLYDVRFAGPEAAQAAVLMQGASGGADRPSADPLSGDGEAAAGRCVKRVDLTNSEVLSSFDVPENTELLDFRLDARVIAIRIPGESQQADRLQIWTCSSEGDRQVLDCRPYEGRSRAKLIWAALVGVNRLLTRDSESKTLDLWELPACRRLDSISWKSKTPPPLSGQRNYLAVPRGGVIEILQTSDFRLAGHLEAEAITPEGLLGGAFDREGKRLAVVVSQDASAIAHVWQLDEGELLKRFVVPSVSSGHCWLDSRYYYAGGTLLDMQEEAAVWKYDHKRCIAASPDGRFWYAAADQAGRPFLCITEAPSREVRTAVERCLTAGLVLGPGSPVSIRMEKKGNPDAQLCQRIESLVGELLAKHGFRAVGGASTTMKINVEEESRESSFRIPGETAHRYRTLSVTLELVDGNDDSYWRQFEVSTMRDDKEEPESEKFETWLRSLALPRKVFRWGTTKTPGSSTLTISGEEIKMR